MELKREIETSEILDPRRDYQPTPTSVEVRWDPLIGYTTRIVSDAPLLPPSDFDLEAFGRETAERCFFCGPRLEEVTPRFPASVVPEGRIRRGEAVAFPNIQSYALYSSVSVYSASLHYLPLERFTPQIVGDALATQVEFVATMMRHDPTARWSSINANHMLPSGSSLFHPHIQGSVDRHPTIVQELLSRVPGEQYRDYLGTEKRLGERYLGRIGCAEWLTSFAPFGFNELRALVPGVAAPSQLTPDQVSDLGEGIARGLNFYAELGCQSFNMAIYGAPPTTDGYMLTVRLVCRSNLDYLYRSDVTNSERMHWQAMVVGTPEDLARKAGDRFRS